MDNARSKEKWEVSSLMIVQIIQKKKKDSLSLVQINLKLDFIGINLENENYRNKYKKNRSIGKNL